MSSNDCLGSIAAAGIRGLQEVGDPRAVIQARDQYGLSALYINITEYAIPRIYLSYKSDGTADVEDSFEFCSLHGQPATRKACRGIMSFTQASRTSPRLRVAPLVCRLRASFLHTSPTPLVKALPPRLKLNEEDIREAFVHGSGPGGQKINKTHCAVQLKHIPSGVTTTCQETRSRSQNRNIARKVLAEKVEALEKGEGSRLAIKELRKSKKKASKSKKARRKYRAAKDGQDEDEDEGEDDENEGELDDGAREEDVKEERVG